MRYYCKNCGATFTAGRIHALPKVNCPNCSRFLSYPVEMDIFDHETVAQWEARTGREYPDSAPVYYCYGEYRGKNWHCDTWRWYMDGVSEPKSKAVVATEAGAPPDDWRPE